MSSVFEPFGHQANAEEARGRFGDNDTDSSASRDTLSEEEMNSIGWRERVPGFVRGVNNVESNDDTSAEVAGRPGKTKGITGGASGGAFYDSHNGTDAKRNAAATARKKRRQARGKDNYNSKEPSPHDVPLEALVALTHALQEQEDRREQQEKIAASVREAEERKLRNERWAEVKARMTARNSVTSALSLRSAEWDDSDDDNGRPSEGYTDQRRCRNRLSARSGGQSMTTVAMADDPLIDPEDCDERPLRKLVKWEKLPWGVEFWHKVYNWFRWAVLGMYNIRDVAEDPSGYYQKRKFD